MSSEPDHHWPEGSVRAAIASDLVTPATAAALRARMASGAAYVPVLDEEAAALLAAICDRLVPQPDRANPVDIADAVHRKLASGIGNGWRFDNLPDDVTAMIAGLAEIDASAVAMFGQGFNALANIHRDTVLAAVEAGSAPGWLNLDPRRFFEELLAAAAEAYYANPLAQEEIGYVGMADVPGWMVIGLNQREPREPAEL